MGPKGKKNEPDKSNLSENDLPSKIAYVSLNKQQEYRFIVNLLCRLDILKDFIRRQISKILVERVNALSLENSNSNNNTSSLFGETTVTPEVAANNALIKKLKDFQSKINGLTINDLALVEENNTVIDTSNTDLFSGPALAILNPMSSYRVGIIQQDKSISYFSE